MSNTEAELQASIAKALSTAMGYEEFDEFARLWEDAGNSPLTARDER